MGVEGKESTGSDISKMRARTRRKANHTDFVFTITLSRVWQSCSVTWRARRASFRDWTSFSDHKQQSEQTSGRIKLTKSRAGHGRREGKISTKNKTVKLTTRRKYEKGEQQETGSVEAKFRQTAGNRIKREKKRNKTSLRKRKSNHKPISSRENSSSLFIESSSCLAIADSWRAWAVSFWWDTEREQKNESIKENSRPAKQNRFRRERFNKWCICWVGLVASKKERRQNNDQRKRITALSN